MMAFRRFIFSAFTLALFCLTFASASSRRHGRDAEDSNSHVVDALATKDAAKGLGEDQTIGNDGASRQRRACYYDPVYGQVCTAPRCTEYDYYGNCVLSVGRRKRDIEDPNSEEVHAVEDQVEFNSEAGYGRRKRDTEDINAASEALGEDKLRINDGDEGLFEDDDGASRQKRSCRRDNRCKRDISYETTDNDSAAQVESSREKRFINKYLRKGVRLNFGGGGFNKGKQFSNYKPKYSKYSKPSYITKPSYGSQSSSNTVSSSSRPVSSQSSSWSSW